MPKKIQRRPIRYLPIRLDKEKTETKGFSIQTAVTIIGGITGIIVAILWVAGRLYVAAYFNAMNIPSFQISYSIWEYAEASWLLLIIYFLNKIYPPTLSVATIILALIILILTIQRIFPSLKIKRAIQIIFIQLQKFWQSIRYVFVLLLGLYFIYFLLLAFIDIKNSGRDKGQLVVLEKSQAAEVFSKDYLPLGQGQIVSNTSPAIIQYGGLKLLTFNNEKYYLFRDIDPITCKPVQVFIINNSPNIQVVLSDFSPVNSPCIKKLTTTSTKKLLPIPTP